MLLLCTVTLQTGLHHSIDVILWKHCSHIKPPLHSSTWKHRMACVGLKSLGDSNLIDVSIRESEITAYIKITTAPEPVKYSHFFHFKKTCRLIGPQVVPVLWCSSTYRWSNMLSAFTFRVYCPIPIPVTHRLNTAFSCPGNSQYPKSVTAAWA